MREHLIFGPYPSNWFSIKRLLFVVVCAIYGCSTTFTERYYVSALDPKTETTNYFKIDLKGKSSNNEIKYTVGFYDRSAVEKLFAENVLEQEHLSSKIKIFDPATGKRLTDLSQQLSAAKSATSQLRKDHLQQALETVAYLLGRYETKLKTHPNLQSTFAQSLALAKQEMKDAETAIEGSDPDIDAALMGLNYARAILETIRVSVDGKVIVRFFDGAGNEIDVASRTLVIFVAGDVSRFTESIRQLAEANEVTQDILSLTLGPKIQQAELLNRNMAVSNQQESAIAAFLASSLEDLDNDANAEQLRQRILSMASALSNTTFNSDDEIRGYVDGKRKQ